MISEVHNCDCVEFMRGLPDNSFDLSIADPPYGGGNSEEVDATWIRFNGTGRQARYKAATELVDGPREMTGWDTAPGEEFFTELRRVARNQIIWGGNYFQLPPTRCFVVWKKLTISENFSLAMAEYAWTSFTGNAKVFEAMPQGMASKRFHPTQKPVALYAWLLRLFAKPGDKIFDPMMGSQSSRIAAYNMGFDYTGCERDPEYFAKGCARFDEECRGIFTDALGVSHEQLSLF